MLISLLCVAVLIVNIIQVAENYFAYRVNVVVSLINKRELTFPAVTVCNMNPVKSSAVINSPALNEVLNSKRRRRRKRTSERINKYQSALKTIEICFNDLGRIYGSWYSPIRNISFGTF